MQTQVTISMNVRTFRRTNPRSVLLSTHNQVWLGALETHTLGPVQRMSFDHCDHDAAEVLSIQSDEPLFVLMREIYAAIAVQ